MRKSAEIVVRGEGWRFRGTVKSSGDVAAALHEVAAAIEALATSRNLGRSLGMSMSMSSVTPETGKHVDVDWSRGMFGWGAV